MSHRLTSLSRREFLLTASIGFGTVLGACSAPAPPTSAPGQSAAPGTSAGSAELVVWPFNYKTHIDAFNQIKSAFEAKAPSVKLKLEPQDNPSAKIAAASAAGTLPDVFENHAKSSLTMIKNKIVRDLDDLVYTPSKLNPSDAFFPGSLVGFLVNGKMWGVPLEDNHVGWSIFARMDAWNGAGLSLPANHEFTTWDDFYLMAQRLVKKDASGNVMRWGYQGVNVWSISYVMAAILEQGANYWDDNAKKFTFYTEPGLKAITTIVSDPANKYGIESDTLGTDSNGNILKNKVAAIQGTNQIIPLAKLDQPDLVIDGALHPTMGPNYVTVSEGGWGFFLNAKAKQLETAVQLLTYLTTREPQSIWTQAVGAQPPALRAVAEEKFWDEPINAMGKKQLAVQEKGVDMTQGHDMGLVQEMETRWMNIAVDLRAGKMTVDDAAKRAEEEFAQQRDDFLKS